MILEKQILDYVKAGKTRVVYDLRPESKLTFLIGLARCGKSTFTGSLKDIPGLVVWNDDNLRLSWYNKRYSSAGESLIHSAKYPVVKSLILGGYHVVVDDTHTTAQNIIRLLNIDSQASFIYFEQSIEVCQDRAIATEQPDLIPVIEKQFRNLQRTFDGDLSTTNMVNTINKLRNIASDVSLKDFLEERIVASL